MEWRDIPGYEGIYEASNTGQIRSKDEKVTHSVKHGRRVWKGRVLKQKVGKDKSCRVSLYKDKKEKTWLVHRLIAKTFIPEVEGKDYINHIDGNRLNNDVTNLEWCNHKENNNHAFDTGLIKTAKKVILVHKETHEPIYFRSMSRASTFLGYRDTYLANHVYEGKSEIDDYEIFLKAK
ncbi:NUMOD4 domain-containing protein [Lysinibacillus varians]|uniref:HNH endonuclease n=1 Tax=Lysinibacillus varians TaxID=1145276 RepID=A0ABY2TCR3_9BACI|nr:NUMOD4 domain-containing protein [Lysinibacillus varians]AHN22719.1 HNH endonuclease [Lysinibacillus varians]TKI66092.1 HNH endonuclease [Lysinibacillus varians]